MHALFVETIAALDAGDNAAVAQRQHRVANIRKLGQIARRQQHGAAARGKVTEQGVNLRLGGDVDALCRFVEQQHLDASAPAISPE